MMECHVIGVPGVAPIDGLGWISSTKKTAYRPVYTTLPRQQKDDMDTLRTPQTNDRKLLSQSMIFEASWFIISDSKDFEALWFFNKIFDIYHPQLLSSLDINF